MVVVGCCTQRETRSKVAGNYAMRSFDDGSIDEFDDDVFDQPPPPKLNIVSRYGTTFMIPSHAHTHGPRSLIVVAWCATPHRLLQERRKIIIGGVVVLVLGLIAAGVLVGGYFIANSRSNSTQGLWSNYKLPTFAKPRYLSLALAHETTISHTRFDTIPPIYLSISLSVHPSIHLSICLSGPCLQCIRDSIGARPCYVQVRWQHQDPSQCRSGDRVPRVASSRLEDQLGRPDQWHRRVRDHLECQDPHQRGTRVPVLEVLFVARTRRRTALARAVCVCVPLS